MFEAADTTPRAEQVAALLGAMRAGRLDDIDGILDGVLDAPDGDSLARISFNSQFATDGGATIVADLNDGANPCIVTTGPLVDFMQRLLPDHRGHRGVLAVSALVVMLAGFAVRRSSSRRRRIGARLCGADRLGVEHRVRRQCPLPARTVGADAGWGDGGGMRRHPTRPQAHRTAPLSTLQASTEPQHRSRGSIAPRPPSPRLAGVRFPFNRSVPRFLTDAAAQTDTSEMSAGSW